MAALPQGPRRLASPHVARLLGSFPRVVGDMIARQLLVVLAAVGVDASKNASAKKATNATWWWRAALAAPTIVPDFEVIKTHVCHMEAACEPPCVWDRHHGDKYLWTTLIVDEWPYFPSECVRSAGNEAGAAQGGVGRGSEMVGWAARGYKYHINSFDGLGHVAEHISFGFVVPRA